MKPCLFGILAAVVLVVAACQGDSVAVDWSDCNFPAMWVTPANKDMQVGETYTFVSSLKPSGCAPKFDWSVDSVRVATVAAVNDTTAVVTARAVGQALLVVSLPAAPMRSRISAAILVRVTQ
jgi:hypothetical protein